MPTTQNIQQNFKYFAFISYSSHDTKWGKRLQRKLEGYRIPATLCSERGWPRYPIKPVFFAPTDIQPGGLSAELQKRLIDSKHLIVICSPHSAKSEWVGREIDFFYKLGRAENIHLFIIEGCPYSDDSKTECINPVFKELRIPEILGANIQEKIFRWPWLNRERAYIQLISKLLNVEFDILWQRHRRQLRQRVFTYVIGLSAFLISMLSALDYNKPIDISVYIKEKVHNKCLPPLHNILVTLQIGEDKKTSMAKTIASEVTFHNIPHCFFGKNTHLVIECENCINVDTTIVLNKELHIPISRNPAIYGNVRFGIMNSITGEMMPEINLIVDGNNVTSDKNGIVSLFIPIEKQKTEYMITSDMPLQDNVIYMPCGKNDIIMVN